MKMEIEFIAKKLRDSIYSQGHLDVKTRKQKLENLKKEILKNEAEVMAALKADLGKSAFETYATEIGFILEEISYTIKHIDSWSRVKSVKTPLTLFPGKSSIHPEPYGPRGFSAQVWKTLFRSPLRFEP